MAKLRFPSNSHICRGFGEDWNDQDILMNLLNVRYMSRLPIVGMIMLKIKPSMLPRAR